MPFFKRKERADGLYAAAGSFFGNGIKMNRCGVSSIARTLAD